MTVENTPAEGSSRALRFGLSGKLLVLTILFVMIAEVLIYVPSIANFRYSWLNDRISAAYTAALVFQAAPRAAAMKMGQRRRLLASADMPPAIDQDIDMRDMRWHRAIIDSFDTLLSTEN